MSVRCSTDTDIKTVAKLLLTVDRLFSGQFYQEQHVCCEKNWPDSVSLDEMMQQPRLTCMRGA